MTGNEQDSRRTTEATNIGSVQEKAKEMQPRTTNQETTISDNTERYWQTRYEQLQRDYDHLQKVNENLEDKLLKVVEDFDKKKEELVANIEYEKSTLMADVNKLSNKLVDARIKLHDYEEKELIHAAECGSPCHKNGGCPTKTTPANNHHTNSTNNNDKTGIPMSVSPGAKTSDQIQMMNDPNLV